MSWHFAAPERVSVVRHNCSLRLGAKEICVSFWWIDHSNTQSLSFSYCQRQRGSRVAYNLRLAGWGLLTDTGSAPGEKNTAAIFMRRVTWFFIARSVVQCCRLTRSDDP